MNLMSRHRKKCCYTDPLLAFYGMNFALPAKLKKRIFSAVGFRKTEPESHHFLNCAIFTAYFLLMRRIPFSDICLCASVCVRGKKTKSGSV